MEEHRFFGKKEIEKYLDQVFRHAIPMSGKEIEQVLGLEDKREYNRRLLQNLNTLFSRGRYSVITEYTIEIWDDLDFLKAVNDVRIINELSPVRRLKLKYLRILLETAQPLFHRKPIDFAESPFYSLEGEFAVKNDLLMEEIENGDYPNLSLMLLSSLIKTYWDDKKFINSIALNEMSQALESAKYEQDKSEKDFRERLKSASNTLIDIDNHMEIGRRMGLNKRAQFIYDALDQFICNQYYYTQVDAAKEYDKWLRKNWNGWDETRQQEQIKEMYDALVSICEKHKVGTYNCASAIDYLTLDLLQLPLPPYKPEEDDWGFDPNDPDFGD